MPDQVKKLRDDMPKHVRRKPRDPESNPDPLDAREFGEAIAVDRILVFRSPDDSNVKE